MNKADFSFFSNPWMDIANTMNQHFLQTWQTQSKSTESLEDTIEKIKANLEETLKFSENQIKTHLNCFPQNPFFQNYQEALNTYFSFLSQMYTQAMELFHEKLSPHQEEKEMLNNMYEISRLWIECCENIYDKMTAHNDYQKLYGEIINAWGRWKFHSPR